MTARVPLSILVVASLFIGALPSTARAGDETPTLSRSIAHAAASLAAKAPRTDRTAARRENGNLEMQGGGGGGHTGMIVMTLVTTAASVGGGYFIYKQMKKHTDPTK